MDSGGTAASATLGNLTATAKYNGVRGNDLAVGIATVSNGFEVSTYLDGNLVHQQIVLSGATPVANDWVTFNPVVLWWHWLLLL